MSDTKACNLTEEEISELINFHGKNVADDMIGHIDRLGYLHKRLKAFKEVELTDVKSTNTAAGWGSSD